MDSPLKLLAIAAALVITATGCDDQKQRIALARTIPWIFGFVALLVALAWVL